MTKITKCAVVFLEIEKKKGEKKEEAARMTIAVDVPFG